MSGDGSPTHLSPEEMHDAISSLSDADRIRLIKISQLFSQVGGYAPNDLRQEAYARALTGRRPCPRRLNVVFYLGQVMRSLASTHARSAAGAPAFESLVAEDGTDFNTRDGTPNAEEAIMHTQEMARMRQALIELFASDLEARTIVEGDMEGIKGEELRELVGLDAKDFASKRKSIRRTIEKAYPRGWQS
jgi:DNA-directed RNA polymerase specialized sigma24 family protein